MKKQKKNPLSKAQNKLLRESLKRLLGPGLVAQEKIETDRDTIKVFFLRAALNELNLK